MDDSSSEIAVEFVEPLFSQIVTWIDPFLALAAIIILFIAARKFKSNSSIPYGNIIFWGLSGSILFSLVADGVEYAKIIDYQVEQNLASLFYLMSSISIIVFAHGILGLANHLRDNSK